MGQRTKVLFVSGEVEPFAKASEIGSLSRHLPQLLHDSGDFEVRIMMPRYGTISERRNRLHEVIRLCGTPIVMGKRNEVLKVKVASIPGIRLQVYFMDNTRYFKRKGLHQDREGVLFKDNAARSLFFTRAVLATIRKLRWKPDVVHALGWISGLLPVLVARKWREDEMFKDACVVYSPDEIQANAKMTLALIRRIGEPFDGADKGLSVSELGVSHADAIAYPSSVDPAVVGGAARNGHVRLSAEHDALVAQAVDLYAAGQANLAQ